MTKRRGWMRVGIDWRRADEFMRQVKDGCYSTCTTVLATMSYFDIFMSYFLLQKGTLSDGREGLIFALPLGDAPYPMIALNDIGYFAAMILSDREKWGGKYLPIGGEEITMKDFAATFERVTGIPAEYQAMPDEVWLSLPIPANYDILNQIHFHTEHGIPRVHSYLRSLQPGLLTFEAWLRKTGWRGELREVHKALINE